MKKRITSILLALVMLIGIFLFTAIPAFAETTDDNRMTLKEIPAFGALNDYSYLTLGEIPAALGEGDTHETLTLGDILGKVSGTYKGTDIKTNDLGTEKISMVLSLNPDCVISEKITEIGSGSKFAEKVIYNQYGFIVVETTEFSDNGEPIYDEIKEESSGETVDNFYAQEVILTEEDITIQELSVTIPAGSYYVSEIGLVFWNEQNDKLQNVYKEGGFVLDRVEEEESLTLRDILGKVKGTYSGSIQTDSGKITASISLNGNELCTELIASKWAKKEILDNTGLKVCQTSQFNGDGTPKYPADSNSDNTLKLDDFLNSKISATNIPMMITPPGGAAGITIPAGSYCVGSLINSELDYYFYNKDQDGRTQTLCYMGIKLTRKIEEPDEPVHEHTFSDNWSYNDTHHWHAATCEHTGFVSDFGMHDYTSTSDTQHKCDCGKIENHTFVNGKCVCGETKTEYTVTFDLQGFGTEEVTSQIVKIGDKVTKPTSDPTDESRIFGGWYEDAECVHEWDFNNYTVIGDTIIYAKWIPISCTLWFYLGDAEGTVTKISGLAHYGQDLQEITPPTREGLVFLGYYDMDEMGVNSVKYYGADGKGTRTWDKEGYKEMLIARWAPATLPPAHEHTYSEATYIWNEDLSKCTAYHTCTTDGCGNIELETVNAEKGDTEITATFTNKAFTRQTKKIEATVHVHTPTLVAGQAPTCTADGWKDYYKCVDTDCAKLFSDPACKNQITLDTWKISSGKIAKLGHKAVEILQQDATTEKDGVKAYWYCGNCNRYFADNSGAVGTEIGDNTALAAWKAGEGKIEKLTPETPHEHSYATATYIWNEDLSKCTAFKTCSCGNAVIETVNTTKNGNTITADFSDAFTDQTKTVEAPHSHTYDKTIVASRYLKSAATCTKPAVYYKSCKCGEASTTETFTDSNAQGHSYDGGKITKEATTTATGVKTYSCTVCGAVLKTETIPKLEPTPSPSPTPEPAPIPKANFTDVKAGAYYEEDVNWAVAKGITSGTSKTTFSPDADCTRGQIVTFLYRAAGEPAIGSGSNPFVDVKSSDYFYKAVMWAVGKKVTSGTDAIHFSPEDTCTRAQAVTFMWRYVNKPAASGSNPFKDIKSSDYYYNAVLWAAANGITYGKTKTAFSPKDKCTRGQIVCFLYRFMGK